MLDLTKEGTRYIVYSKKEGNTFQISFPRWVELAEYIKNEKGVYKIMSVGSSEIPLTGLELRKD